MVTGKQGPANVGQGGRPQPESSTKTRCYAASGVSGCPASPSTSPAGPQPLPRPPGCLTWQSLAAADRTSSCASASMGSRRGSRPGRCGPRSTSGSESSRASQPSKKARRRASPTPAHDSRAGMKDPKSKLPWDSATMSCGQHRRRQGPVRRAGRGGRQDGWKDAARTAAAGQTGKQAGSQTRADGRGGGGRAPLTVQGGRQRAQERPTGQAGRQVAQRTSGQERAHLHRSGRAGDAGRRRRQSLRKDAP